MPIESDKLPPVPTTVYPLQKEGSSNKFTIPWVQWFEQVRVKVDLLNAKAVSLLRISGTGFISTDPTGTRTRTITGTASKIAVTNGDGVSGNPTVNLIATAVTPGTYGDVSNIPRVTIDADGRITTASNIPVTTGGGGRLYFDIFLGDVASAITTGVGKGYWTAPTNLKDLLFTTDLFVSSSVGIPTFDINKNGTDATILSTKITIDALETSSRTAAIPYVATDTFAAVGDRYTFDIDVAGTGAQYPLMRISALLNALNYLNLLSVQPRAVLSLGKKISTATLSIRVRRSSDSTEQDIGFVGDILDTAALATFVGAGSGFVRTFYDQTGNLEHAEQATASKQPRIVNAGAYDGKLVFDGTDDSMTITSLVNTGMQAAIYSKVKQDIGATRIIFESSANYNSNVGSLIFYADVTIHSVGMNNNATGTQRRNDYTLGLTSIKKVSVLCDRSLTGTDEIKTWVDGVAMTPTAGSSTDQTVAFSTYDLFIGARAGTSLYANMELETFVFYNANTLSIRTDIEALI